MFNNISGKQGFLFGIVSGSGLMAVVAFTLLAVLVAERMPTVSRVADDTPAPPVVALEQNQNASVPANIPKSDRPNVELFVMSYCPYGMDMEQNALIPAYNVLKDKADIAVKFVSYAMHGKQEVEENTNQFCAQQQGSEKYFKYLSCFNSSGDSASCLKQAGLNENQLTRCVTETNKKYGILDKYNDQATWLSGQYPVYPIHEELNNKYQVQGSPTLVINGTQVQADRTAAGLTSAICAAFNKAPAECEQYLSAVPAQPAIAATQNNQGGCGGKI